MTSPQREGMELFLQEASEHLQYLREYVGVLQEIGPRHEDLERLYIAAHTLGGTSASYEFPGFAEIASKLSHVFQYAMNAPLGDDLHGPLAEFLSDAISLLETDLLEISDKGSETIDEIHAFKERYSFAFPEAAPKTTYAVPAQTADLPAPAAHSVTNLLLPALILISCHPTMASPTRFWNFSSQRLTNICKSSAIA